MKYIKHQPANEQGFASLAIALVMILVLALLTTAFAQLSRREQQNALDKQLASQAYYATESGINDAYTDIKSKVITSSMVDTAGGPNTCLTPAKLPAAALSKTPIIDKDTGVSYTCLLINLKPPTLVWTDVDPGNSRSAAFSNQGSGLESFTVKWQSSDGHTTPRPGVNGFTTLSEWANSPAVIELRLTPITSSLDRATLSKNTFTVYLYPATYGNGKVSVKYTTDSDKQGQVIPARCNGGSCSIQITGLSTSGSTGYYVSHILDYYDQSNISYTDPLDKDGKEALFTDGQAVIDVTGRAKDILKRLQVRVPLTATATDVPDFAMEASNICKRQQTRPATPTEAAKTEYIDLNGAPLAADSDDPCNAAK